MPLKTSDEKQDLTLKVFDYFEAESKLSLGESEMNISCMLTFKRYKMASNYDIHSAPCIRAEGPVLNYVICWWQYWISSCQTKSI
jgi:hypothetical protein